MIFHLGPWFFECEEILRKIYKEEIKKIFKEKEKQKEDER